MLENFYKKEVINLVKLHGMKEYWKLGMATNLFKKIWHTKDKRVEMKINLLYTS